MGTRPMPQTLPNTIGPSSTEVMGRGRWVWLALSPWAGWQRQAFAGTHGMEGGGRG